MQYTHNGLDVMVNRFFEVIEDILLSRGASPTLHGPEFDYMWRTKEDLEGGLDMLNVAFHQSVLSGYK